MKGEQKQRCKASIMNFSANSLSTLLCLQQREHLLITEGITEKREMAYGKKEKLL